MLPEPSTFVAATVFEESITAEAFLIGRLLFGLVLAFMGLNHFMDPQSLTGYAESKGIPAPRLSVFLSGGTLIFGGLGIAAGAFTTVAAGALIVFFLITTPTMHNFWAVPDEQTQTQMQNFLKNLALLGGSLVFFALSTTEWPYAVGGSLL